MSSLSELSRQMHCPIDYNKIEPILKKSNDSSLSYVPWKLVTKESSNSAANDKTTVDFFPTYSYLDLRRKQNLSWADSRHEEGEKWAYINEAKAEKLFLEGLDLIPDHVNILISYGKLLVRKGATATTMDDWDLAEEKYKRVLNLEPGNQTAKSLLKLLGAKRRSRQTQPTDAVTKELTLNSSRNAYSDVLMEKSLATGVGYDLIESDQDSAFDGNKQERTDSVSERKRSRRERKRSKSSKKKKRRRRYSSSSFSSSSSSSLEPPGSKADDPNSMSNAESSVSDDDDDAYRRRRRKKERDRKKRKRKRKYESKKRTRKKRKEREDEESR